MKEKILILVLLLFIGTLPAVSAHCPLCTGAAIAGVTATRFYGIDDRIVGLFLGGFIISMALWFNSWVKKKRVNFFGQEALIVAFSFLATVIPFYYAGLITDFEMVRSMPEYYSPFGLGVLWMDRLLFGIILGMVSLWATFKFSDYLKKKKGKVLWPYQGLSLMLAVLIFLSLIFWGLA